MPPRLPQGLLELSLLSLNTQRIPRIFSRAYQSISSPERTMYAS